MRILARAGTYLAETGAAVRLSYGDRVNFALLVVGMIVNDGLFLLLWFMFFQGFGSVGGWRQPDVALLMGLICVIVALAGIFAGGYRDLARTILSGDIDALLTQPQSILPRLLARESIISSWGDLIVGVLLISFFTEFNAADVPWLLLAMICGLVVYLGAAVSFASIAFWLSGARSLARDLVEYMILFSTYPGSIYTGVMKVAVYTVFPAGFVVLIPVAFLRNPNLSDALLMLGAAGFYGALGIGLFHIGLRRYRRA